MPHKFKQQMVDLEIIMQVLSWIHSAEIKALKYISWSMKYARYLRMRWDVQLFWKFISTGTHESCILEVSMSGSNFLAPNCIGTQMGDL